MDAIEAYRRDIQEENIHTTADITSTESSISPSSSPSSIQTRNTKARGSATPTQILRVLKEVDNRRVRRESAPVQHVNDEATATTTAGTAVTILSRGPRTNQKLRSASVRRVRPSASDKPQSTQSKDMDRNKNKRYLEERPSCPKQAFSSPRIVNRVLTRPPRAHTNKPRSNLPPRRPRSNSARSYPKSPASPSLASVGATKEKPKDRRKHVRVGHELELQASQTTSVIKLQTAPKNSNTNATWTFSEFRRQLSDANRQNTSSNPQTFRRDE